MQRTWIFALLLSLLPGHVLAAAKPNILLILADDLGFSDLGCYGGEIQTPHLDALANDGLRFTQFYNTARCWPTRAALLTGYYAQQVRRDALPDVAGGTSGVRPEWARLLPEMLRPLGYRSYHSGKWHIDGPRLAAGFDRSYSLEDHNRLFARAITSWTISRCLPSSPTRATMPRRRLRTTPSPVCGTMPGTVLSNPSFAFLAFTAPHFPLQAPADDVARYRDVYLQGWDAVRAAALAADAAAGADRLPACRNSSTASDRRTIFRRRCSSWGRAKSIDRWTGRH